MNGQLENNYEGYNFLKQAKGTIKVDGHLGKETQSDISHGDGSIITSTQEECFMSQKQQYG